MTKTAAATWDSVLTEQKQQPYFKAILDQLDQAYDEGKTVYPDQADIFNAFNLTPYEDIKVVIIGQDPYHGPHQAHGLCFSVKKGVAVPPSLKNIYKELHADTGFIIPSHGNLEDWAKQGVLLLNSTLTVEAGKPQSHAKFGWQTFTDNVIKLLNDHPEPLVFLLWGASAQRKGQVIDTSRHHVLQSVHPSPLSAHRGFLGCKHFSKTNEILRSIGHEPINWQLSD
ncbi:MAG: uracil-DNA glycosylase [Coxiellaceae bacterium]|nr:uracil-DNA glycosylase [Coxiellaceae bacterium]